MKNLKKISVVTLLLSLVMLVVSQAYAGDISLFADKVFDRASLTLYSDKTVSFSASTWGTKKSISVSSCFLQKKNGEKWDYVKSLTAPKTVASNAFLYGSDMDYSDDIPDGGTYRIGAVFDADGYTITRYSSAKSF